MSASAQIAVFPGDGKYGVTITKNGRTAVIQVPGGGTGLVSAALYIKGTRQADELIKAAIAAKDLLTTAAQWDAS